MNILEDIELIRARSVNRGFRIDADDDDDTAPAKTHHGNTRLPFGLCKRFGITTDPKWTPKDAWEALEGKTGLTHDAVMDYLAKKGDTTGLKKKKKTTAKKPAKKTVDKSAEVNTFINDYKTAAIGTGGRYTACNNLIKALENDETISFGDSTIRCETDKKGWARYYLDKGKSTTELTRAQATDAIKKYVDGTGIGSAKISIKETDDSLKGVGKNEEAKLTTPNKKRNAKNPAHLNVTSEDYSTETSTNKKGGKKVTFSDEAYSQENKDNAVWIENDNPSVAEKYSEQFARDQQGDLIKEIETNPTLKMDFNRFTKGSNHLNTALRGLKAWGAHCPWASKTESINRANNITQMLDKSTFKTDIWVQRDVSALSAEKLFGVSSLSQLKVGDEGTDKGFTSCGLAKGTGYMKGDVYYNIYCPRGTKALYINSVSEYLKDPSFNENEILLQRGTKFKITKIEKPSSDNGYKWYIDLDVVSQEHNGKIPLK